MATMAKLGFALLVGFVVFAILVPTSGSGSRCFSLLAFEVPCGRKAGLRRRSSLGCRRWPGAVADGPPADHLIGQVVPGLMSSWRVLEAPREH